MELSRRLAKGRLSEIIGKRTVELDMFTRLTGMDKAMERMAREASKKMTVARDGIYPFAL